MQPLFIADDFHPCLMENLRNAGIPFTYQPNATRKDIVNALAAGSPGLVIRSKTFVDEDVLSNAPLLKFIARGGAGMDNVDLHAAEKHGIVCFNSENANSDAVGEHALGMLLSLFRRLHTADAEVRHGIWNREENRGIELNGKTIGIVGFGNTGSAFAKKLSGFDVEIIAFDKFKKNFSTNLVRESTMDDLFQNAEIVSFHVPLDSHTKLMVNSDYLQSFVRKIFLLNLSRGGILRTSDVISGLKSGKILGFGADVLEHEDPARMGDDAKIWFNELVQLPNVILSPHIAGWTFESYEKISKAISRGIIERFHAWKGF